MINIIRSDIYRILRSPAFYIALLLLGTFAALNVYTVQGGTIGVMVASSEAEPMGNKLDEMSIDEMGRLTMKDYREILLTSTNYKLEKDVFGKNMNLYYFFIFAIVLAITGDFTGGSIKNTLSSAISRKKYFFSKLFVILGMNTLLLFLYNYGTHFGNMIFNNSNVTASMSYVTKTTFLQLPLVFTISSFFLAFAFILKKTAIFNTVMIPLTLVVPLLISFISRVFSLRSDKLLDYDITVMFFNLANKHSNGYLAETYAICAAFIAASLLIGWNVFKKTEIK